MPVQVDALSKPSKVWLWIKANGHIPCAGVGALFVGLGAIGTVFLVIGAILSLAGITWGLFAAPKVHDLLDREAEARSRAADRTEGLKDILRLILHEIATQMQLDLSHTRLSVYTHGDSSFSMVKRHSTNPILQAPSRNIYPDSEGLIGAVWTRGQCTLVTKLPKDRDRWDEKCSSRWGMPLGTAQSLSMQSRSMLGRRIDAPGHEPVGVIILESTEPTGLTGSHKDQLEQFSGVLLKVLTLIIRKMDELDGLSAGTSSAKKPHNSSLHSMG